MLTDANITLNGKRYLLKLTKEAIDQITKLGVDFWHPPRRRDQENLNRYLVAVFASAAHVEHAGVLRHAGLSIEDAEDMIDVKNGELVFSAINQAIADHNRRIEAAELHPQRATGISS